MGEMVYWNLYLKTEIKLIENYRHAALSGGVYKMREVITTGRISSLLNLSENDLQRAYNATDLLAI